MVIINDSPADAVVENLNIYLRFDGEFAGTNYERFAPLEVPKGETRVVTLDLLISTPSIQPKGGTAQLSLDGSLENTGLVLRRTVARDDGRLDAILPGGGEHGLEVGQCELAKRLA